MVVVVRQYSRMVRVVGVRYGEVAVFELSSTTKLEACPSATVVQGDVRADHTLQVGSPE